MKQGTRLLTGSAIIGVLALGFSTPSLAANECKIKYGYHTGSGNSRQDKTKTVYINKSTTKLINQNNLNYVKNLKSTEATFYLDGFGVRDVTLGQNQVNPLPPSFYLSQVKLKKVKCLDNASSNNSTPNAMVSAMKAAGNTASAIALALKNTFNQTQKQVTQLLKNAGYTTNQIAAALKSAFNATAIQVAKALKAAGYAVNQIAAALKSAFNATATQVAKALKAAGYAVNQIAAALKSTFNATAKQVAQALKAAGYAARQIAAALKSAFNASVDQVAKALKAAGYTADQIAASLKGAFNASATAIAKALKAAGYTLDQTAAALKQGLKLTRQLTEAALKAASYAASQIKAVLDRLYGQAETATGRALAGAMKIRNVFLGTYDYSLVARRCFFPSGRTLYGPGVGSVPFPNTNRAITVTITGDNLMTASSIAGLPRGASARITARGNCGIQLEIRIPRSVARNTRGTAYVMSARQRGPAFPYVVGPIPSNTGNRTAPPPARGNTPTRGNAGSSRPDLIPFQAQNRLYKVGSGTTLDDQNNLYTALYPFNNSAFCQTIPQGGITSNNMLTANRRTITVPNILWGVENKSDQAVNNPFNIQLLRGNQVVASRTINSLAANQVSTFSYSRPSSQTCVARVGSGNGCYHCGKKTEGWNDNPGYTVKVDSGNAIQESSERNNRRNL